MSAWATVRTKRNAPDPASVTRTWAVRTVGPESAGRVQRRRPVTGSTVMPVGAIGAQREGEGLRGKIGIGGGESQGKQGTFVDGE